MKRFLLFISVFVLFVLSNKALAQNITLNLGDFVWNDINANGIQDIGESGIAGVTVKLTYPGGATSTTTTSSTGAYLFSNLSAGTYSITFTTPIGYTSSPSNQGADNTTDSDPINGTVSGIVLAIGQNDLTIDAGFYNNFTCTNCILGYPDNSNLPRSAVVFNENDVLRAMEPSSTTCGILQGGTIKVWYNDEHAILLGVDSVVVKRANGTKYSTKYPITPYSGTPSCASGLSFGTTISSGAQAGNDVADGGGRPLRPALFLTDLTVNGTTSRVGDWQQGGMPYNPTTICGSWKSGYRFVDSSVSPVIIDVLPYADPVKNDWNLAGGEAPPAGSVNEGYGALIKWDVNSLGLIPGHTYRIQVMVHDGDQNKVGGDAGSMCTTIYVPIPSYDLGNTVWYDQNNDGNQNVGEPGISGVTVKLYNCSGTYMNRTVVTDANGNYVFTGIPSGNYIVGITPPTGYVKSDVGATNIGLDTQNDGVNVVATEIRTNCFTLTTTSNNIDFGIKGTGSIGDFVWNDDNRNGIQDAGEAGINGATVTLTYPSGAQVTTTTNASGAYVFSNLPPGTYTVIFTTPAGYTASPANQGTDDTKDSDPVAGSVSVTLTTGQNSTTIDAGFYAVLNLGNSVWLDINNNGLKDTNEPGISGLTVKLYADANGDNIPDGAAVATTSTDANGTYAFTNLQAGNYIVGVTLPTGYVAGATTTNSLTPNGDIDNDNNGVTTVSGELRSNFITLSANGEPVSGVDGDGTNGNLTLDFGLKGTGSIGNFVWNDINVNGIQDIGESGIAGVTVTLTFANGSAVSTTTDANGGYLFTDLLAGTYSISFTTPTGYTPSPSNQGADNTTDSDPINGTVSGIVLAIGQNDLTIDAGFYSNLTCTTCLLGYPDNSNLPRSAVVFNENDILRAMEPSSTTCGILQSGTIKVWYNDEHAILLGVDSVVVKRANGTKYSTKYPITPYSGTPSCASGLSFGTTIASGAQAGNDTEVGGGRPLRPALFLTDLTVNGSISRVGDWQQGGMPYNPTTICGSWKSGYRYVDSSVNPVNVDVIPYADPVKNDWNLAGGEAPPAGSVNEGYGALIKWDVNSLGLIPGHTYRIQVMVHDGDQNKVGGDAGTMCTTIYVPIPSYSLGNTIWYDQNNDGNQNVGEPGIAGVTVKLYNCSGTYLNKTVVTDANGNYLFTGIPAGNYIVGITTPAGYTKSDVGATNIGLDTQNDGVNVVATEIRTNCFTFTTTSNNIDFGLKGTGCIGDFVWADYNGNGLQDIGEPGLEGVTVTLTYPNGTSITTTTNASGNYQFTGLPAGTYNVNFVSPTGATPTTANVGGNSAIDSDPIGGNVTVVLNAGQCRSDIDAGFVCCVEILQLGNLVWLDANGNGILDGAETGIANVTVNLYKDSNGDNIPDGAVIATTTTSAAGIYNFINLASGKYIVGVVLPSGKIASTLIGTSFTPDNNIDNDNNGVVTVGGEVRSNYKTLGANNYTLDFGLRNSGSGTGSIGNYVWNDLNKNGIQEAVEPPIQNATVTLTYPDNSTTATVTDANGYYIFPNLSAGTYKVTFTTPAGMLASPAAQGGNTALDSDPVGGIVTGIALTTGQNRTDIDAGFYLVTDNTGLCGPGYVNKVTTLVKNGNFSNQSLTPGSGNSFSGNSGTTGITYVFTDGNFKAQSKFDGLNIKPSDKRAFALINSPGIFNGGGSSLQAPFPGDANNNIAASNTWLYHNGNDLGGEYLIWEQTVTGLVIGQDYRFRFYATNVSEGGKTVDPIIRIRTGGTTGLPNGTQVTGPITLDEASTTNASPMNGWKRFEYAFTASATSLSFKITDGQTSSGGDELGLTAIGVDYCTKDTDGDGVGDIDDIDADNDGILNTVESGGYDPFGDCDADGILNYKDATPGCAGLVWTDCNNDGINDFFDFDGDGIINALDLDSDNDGIPDFDEARDTKGTDNNNDGMVDGVDVDGDGLMSSADANDNVFGGPGLTPEDLDRDGKPNYLDLDSDGDGITDLTEATGTYDTDGLANGTDSDGDGLRGGYTNGATVADNYNGFGGKGVKMLDSDNDGKPDAYDIDSDNDGITDNIEAQPTCSFKLPTGLDTDGDGVDNAYDLTNNTCAKSSGGITPYDKDADGIPDYLDLDTDNDGAPDVNEASGQTGNFVTNYNDTDGDGMIDQFDSFNIKTATGNFTNNVGHNQMGPSGNFDGPTPSGSTSQLIKSQPGDCSSSDRDWRECTILPVTLIEFKGNLYNNVTNLQWTVTNEANLDRYEVERSLDGVTYTKVAAAAARGAVLKTTYAAQDNISGLNATVLYYRLKMIDKPGSYKYSNIITFKLNGKKAGVQVNPNPATSFFSVKITAVKDGNASIRVIDLSGKVIAIQTLTIQKGSNTVMYNDLSKYAAGTYMVQVQMDGEIFSEKLLVTK